MKASKYQISVTILVYPESKQQCPSLSTFQANSFSSPGEAEESDWPSPTPSPKASRDHLFPLGSTCHSHPDLKIYSPLDDTAGADIAITYTSTDATSIAEEISKKHGVRIEAFKCNVNSSKEIDQTVQDVQKSFEREVDIGINNAGGLHIRVSQNSPEAEPTLLSQVSRCGSRPST